MRRTNKMFAFLFFQLIFFNKATKNSLKFLTKIVNPKISQLLSELYEQLNFIDLEIDDLIKKCEKAI